MQCIVSSRSGVSLVPGSPVSPSDQKLETRTDDGSARMREFLVIIPGVIIEPSRASVS